MDDFQRIAAVIRHLDEHHGEQPDLDALARVAGLPRYRFHRLFTRWAGTTPKAFLRCLTLAHARALLAAGRDVLGTALEVGLSGPGRLHDLTVDLEAASPGELRRGGEGWTLVAGHAASPFGSVRLAEGPRGIVELAFVDSAAEDPRPEGAAALAARWPRARVRWDDEHARGLAARVFRPAGSTECPAPGATTGGSPLRAYARGSRFQQRVWRALLEVPPGAAVSYGSLAAVAGAAGAARAVGTAVGANPLAVLIPCHRVLRATGVVGEYRWGRLRKRALLARESCLGSGRSEPEPSGDG